MKPIPKGENLIAQLMADSCRFDELGNAYQLLQEYFDGFSLETLRPLMASSDRLVQRAGVWITAELGLEARSLLCDAVPLTRSRDTYIRYHALEIVTVCSIADDVDEFVHVIPSLTDEDEVIRVLGMRLVSNADLSQLNS